MEFYIFFFYLYLNQLHYALKLVIVTNLKKSFLPGIIILFTGIFGASYSLIKSKHVHLPHYLFFFSEYFFQLFAGIRNSL